MKPEPWLASMFSTFSQPGDLVFDLYAGLGSAARACASTERRYVGAELDPVRHAEAMRLLAEGIQKGE